MCLKCGGGGGGVVWATPAWPGLISVGGRGLFTGAPSPLPPPSPRPVALLHPPPGRAVAWVTLVSLSLSLPDVGGETQHML